jgi:hypothetical protein
VFFDVHVLELAGLEDLAALFAFDEFAVFLAAHDLHARVLAGLLDFYAWAGRLRLGGHKYGTIPLRELRRKGDFARISGIVERPEGLSSPSNAGSGRFCPLPNPEAVDFRLGEGV